MNRFTFFDSLRGIAAFIVLVGHYFPETYFKSLPVINLLSDTKLSVCIFFVLSGFVLMQVNKKYEINIFHLIMHGIARFIRLFIPVATVSVFVYIIYNLGFMSQSVLSENYTNWTVYQKIYAEPISFIQLIDFIFLEAFFFYDNTTTIIPPVWTMRPELFGSFVIFILLWVIYSLKLKINPLYLASLSIVIFLFYYLSVPFIYYFGFFLMGASIRLYHDQNVNLKRISVYWLLLALFTKTVFEFINIDNIFLDFFFASLIIFLILRCKSTHDLLDRKIFTFLGLISFPLYLLHVPIISSLGIYLFLIIDNFNVSVIIGQWIVFIVVALATVFLSYLLLNVETFSINISRSIRKINLLTIFNNK